MQLKRVVPRTLQRNLPLQQMKGLRLSVQELRMLNLEKVAEGFVEQCQSLQVEPEELYKFAQLLSVNYRSVGLSKRSQSYSSSNRSSTVNAKTNMEEDLGDEVGLQTPFGNPPKADRTYHFSDSPKPPPAHVAVPLNTTAVTSWPYSQTFSQSTHVHRRYPRRGVVGPSVGKPRS